VVLRRREFDDQRLVHIVVGEAGLVFRTWPSSVGDFMRVEFDNIEADHMVGASIHASRAAWREFIEDLAAELDYYDRKGHEEGS
jgi:hypothetical protein